MGYEEGYDPEYEAEVMGDNAKLLESEVVGHRIIDVREDKYNGGYPVTGSGVTLVLDNGNEIEILATNDCCAYTDVRDFKFLAKTDNVVTRVETQDNFEQWYIYAAEVPVVSLGVDWSPGNPYYYGFGFNIAVKKKENN